MGKEIAEYVREQQALDREERAAWRESQKRQVEIWMAELQVEDKKRADEIRISLFTGSTIYRKSHGRLHQDIRNIHQ